MTDIRCPTCGQLDENIIFLEGFDAAMNLVYETLNGGDFTLAYTMADVIEMIENEEALYIKGD